MLLNFIDKGTFGCVYKVYNIINKTYYVFKIITDEDDFQYKEELKMCEKINKIPNNTYFAKMIESFEFNRKNKKYYIFVNELLGYNLYKFMKCNEFRGFHIEDIKMIAKKLLKGIKILHQNKIVHTDLRPENILLIDSRFKNVTDETKIPFNVSKSLMKKKYNSPYKRVNNANVKIIDFGSAVQIKDIRGGVVTLCTMNYRPPEVILKCKKYNEKVDIWSLGCILLELYTGEYFFNIDYRDEIADLMHLANIEKACGHCPKWMIKEPNKKEILEIFEEGEKN